MCPGEEVLQRAELEEKETEYGPGDQVDDQDQEDHPTSSPLHSSNPGLDDAMGLATGGSCGAQKAAGVRAATSAFALRRVSRPGTTSTACPAPSLCSVLMSSRAARLEPVQTPPAARSTRYSGG